MCIYIYIFIYIYIYIYIYIHICIIISKQNLIKSTRIINHPICFQRLGPTRSLHRDGRRVHHCRSPLGGHARGDGVRLARVAEAKRETWGFSGAVSGAPGTAE